MFFLFSIKRDHWSGNSFQVAVALTRVVTVRARLMEKNVLQLMSWNKKTELIGYRWWVARNGARPRFRTAEFQTEEAAAAAGCAAAGAAALPRSRLLLRFLKISFQNGKKKHSQNCRLHFFLTHSVNFHLRSLSNFPNKVETMFFK